MIESGSERRGSAVGTQQPLLIMQTLEIPPNRDFRYRKYPAELLDRKETTLVNKRHDFFKAGDSWH